jgi:hypothetical protein
MTGWDINADWRRSVGYRFVHWTCIMSDLTSGRPGSLRQAHRPRSRPGDLRPDEAADAVSLFKISWVVAVADGIVVTPGTPVAPKSCDEGRLRRAERDKVRLRRINSTVDTTGSLGHQHHRHPRQPCPARPTHSNDLERP